MSKKRARRQFSIEQKADVLRRNMIEKVPVSELCNELNIQPSFFYTWQRQAFENLPAALNGPASTGPSRREKELAAEVARLEERLSKKDGVIAGAIGAGAIGVTPSIFILPVRIPHAVENIATIFHSEGVSARSLDRL